MDEGFTSARYIAVARDVLLTGKEAPWSTGKYWYADPMINEYQYSWQ